LPLTAAALVLAEVMGASALPATMDQLVVLPEQVFLMMMLPAKSTSMPRSASVQLLPSIRLREPVAWMPAPSPAPLPLEVQVLPRMMQSLAHRMPSSVLYSTMQSTAVELANTLMPP